MKLSVVFLRDVLNIGVVLDVEFQSRGIVGFELNAVDYLLKPITFARFFNAIEKFKAQQQIPIDGETPIPIQLKLDYIFVTKNRKKVKIIFDNILYIESIKDYIRIHLTNESITVKFSISAFQKELDTRFIRIHRSYIVNHDKITAYTKHDIEIEKIELPIGENYKKNIINL